MATITKLVNRGIDQVKRYQYFSSSTDKNDSGSSFSAGDIIQVERSLGKPAKYVWIKTVEGTVLSIRLNSRITVFSPANPQLNDNPMLSDLSSARIISDSSMDTLPIPASTIWELDNCIPVSDIELATFSSGSFELVVM